MYISYLGFFSIIILQFYIIHFCFDLIKLDNNHKNYTLNNYIKNCSYLLTGIIIIYITTHCYFLKINKSNENDYIVLFLSLCFLFYYSYTNISWFSDLLMIKK